MSTSQRRPKAPGPTRPHRRKIELERTPQIPSSAYVTAYEAQLIHGRDDLARAVESRDADVSGQGSRGCLIKWAGDHDGDEEIWLDRHDILHLLPSLPVPPSHSVSSPVESSSSWDDMPSDLEGTFLLSGDEEVEVFERKKKRKWMEALREDRLREREREEDARELDQGIPLGKGKIRTWGGNDEAPLPPILNLMSHTAQSLSTSPNPRLLEMRILTHHAQDERFDFLRGRYKDTWIRLKSEARQVKAKPKEEKAMGALVGGYESSDDEMEGEVMGPLASPPPPPPGEAPPEPDDAHTSPSVVDEREEEHESHLIGKDEEETKRQRRLRAEEWKRKRAKISALDHTA